MNDKTAKLEQTVTRKPYHTPRMDDYGFVSQLTQTSVVYSLYNDAGIFPNSYSSVPL